MVDTAQRDQILAGPRGRELCARMAGVSADELSDRLLPSLGTRFLRLEPGASPAIRETLDARDARRPVSGRFDSPVGRDVRGVDPAVVAEELRRRVDDWMSTDLEGDDPLVAVPELAETIEEAIYWGGDEPAIDLLGSPETIQLLAPVADRLAQSAGCAWWWSNIDRSAQRYIQWTGRDETAPALTGLSGRLRIAKDKAAADERRHARDLHLPAGTGVSGAWWSTPPTVSTTRRVGGLGAVLLAGQEDGHGDTDADVWSLAVGAHARVLEIHHPEAFQELVTAYPRTATGRYRHTWAWTGWDGDWYVPDWPAVANEWDGIHLSVAGYLSTAGRALPVRAGRTLLAGWNPDETYWLSDILALAGPVQIWQNPSATPLGWQVKETPPHHPGV